jgi:hypothetical protein
MCCGETDVRGGRVQAFQPSKAVYLIYIHDHDPIPTTRAEKEFEPAILKIRDRNAVK